MDKILIVSHCILNTASKVVSYNQEEMKQESANREKLIKYVLKNNIQLLQLPCPEFNLYGAKRWGHVKEQFKNAGASLFTASFVTKIGNNLIDKVGTCLIAYLLIISLPAGMKSTLKGYSAKLHND